MKLTGKTAIYLEQFYMWKRVMNSHSIQATSSLFASIFAICCLDANREFGRSHMHHDARSGGATSHISTGLHLSSRAFQRRFSGNNNLLRLDLGVDFLIDF